MLLANGLGVLWSAVVVVVVGTWFVVRQKWRSSVMRREEIRRLIALASQEAAWAELEAATSYSYGSALSAEPAEEHSVVAPGSFLGRQLQYQCEVCFSPTTTRCKQCKAVHYCSAKCQIIHWRKGHKDECLSFHSLRSINEVADSSAKEFKQDEVRRSVEYIEIKMTHPTVALESPTGEVPWDPTRVPNGKKTTELVTSDDVAGSNTAVKLSTQSLPDKSSLSTSSSFMSVACGSNSEDSGEYGCTTVLKSVKPLSLEKQPFVDDFEDSLDASGMSNPPKSSCLAADERPNSSISSGSLASCSRDLSLPTSGFWEGTIEPIRVKVDAPDEICDVTTPFLQSCFPRRVDVQAEVLDEDTNNGGAYVSVAAASIAENSTNEAGLSEEHEDGLKSGGPVSLNSKLPCDLGVSYSEQGSEMEEAKSSISFSSNEHEKSISGRKNDTAVAGVSWLQSLAPKLADSSIGVNTGLSDEMKCLKEDSSKARASDSFSSSMTSSKKQNTVGLESQYYEQVTRISGRSVDNNSNVRDARDGTNPSVRRVLHQPNASRFVSYSSGAESGILGKYEGAFPYELFVKLYHWNKVPLRPSGLMNCGNSCFANAVIQCLAFTPPLTAYFLEGIHSKACEKNEWCFTCEFEALVQKAKESDSPQSPAPILSQMHHVGSHLGNGGEEDAHEFLRYAVDAMQSVCLKEAGVIVPNSLNEETTLVGLTFGGYLRSKIVCLRCGGRSEQHERIMDLTVEIGANIGSLEEALRQFTRSEILDGENKYHCSRCKSYERAKKKLRVLEAPNILTIALKRFQSGKFGKLNKAVKFPEILNLAPFMSGTSDKSPIYQLYGVVVHLDVMNAAFSGHYVCYVKNNRGRWFQADDSMVQTVELEKVLSKGAYMLLYARCLPRAPRPIRSSTVARDPRKSKNFNCKSKLHSAEPWNNNSVCDLSGDTCRDCFYLHRAGFNPSGSCIEEDSTSENSSSSFFSEAGSHISTDSSNRETTSTDDNFDHILGDASCWYRPWKSSSDSDTSSLSSSPSPLHVRQSPLADLDRCSSDAETSCSCLSNMGSEDVFWTRTSSKVDPSRIKERCSYFHPDSPKVSRKLGHKGNNSCSLGCNNSRDNASSLHSRTMMGRAD